MDFADRYVTVANPLTAFNQVYFELVGLSFLSSVYAEPVMVPLRGWSFDQLRQHIADLLHEYAALAEGVEHVPQNLGDNLGTAMTAAAGRALKAFRRPGFIAERASTPIGLQPGSVIVQHVLNELVVHCWDLATAMNRRNAFPDWLAQRCQLSWQVFFDTYGRSPHNFDPEQPAPPDATPTTRLAAYLGRGIPDLPIVLSRQ